MGDRIPKGEGTIDPKKALSAAGTDDIEEMMMRELARAEAFDNPTKDRQGLSEKSRQDTGAELVHKDLVAQANEEVATFGESFPADTSPKDHPEARGLVDEAKTHQQTLIQTLDAIVASESAKVNPEDAPIKPDVLPESAVSLDVQKESPEAALLRLSNELESAELAWQIEQAHIEQAEQNDEEVSSDAALRVSELYDTYQKTKGELLAFRNQMKEGSDRLETPSLYGAPITPPGENLDTNEKSDGEQISQEEKQPTEKNAVAQEESAADDEKIKSDLIPILEEIKEEKLHFRPQDEAIIRADIDTWKQLVESGQFFDFSQVVHDPEQPQKKDHVDSVYGLLLGYTEKLKARIERYQQMQFDPESIEINQKLFDSIAAVLPELESRRPKPESKSVDPDAQQNAHTAPVEVSDPGHTESTADGFESDDLYDKEKRRQYDPMRLYLKEVANLTDEEMPKTSYEVLTGYIGKGNDRQPTFQTFDTYHDALAFNAGVAPDMQRVLDAVAREYKTQRIVFKWDKDFFDRIADPKDPLNRHQGRIFTLVKRMNEGKEPDAYAEAVMRGEVLPKPAAQSVEAPKDTIAPIPVTTEQPQKIEVVEPIPVTGQEKNEPVAQTEGAEMKDPYEGISPKLPPEFEKDSAYYRELKTSSDPLVTFARDVMKIPVEKIPAFSYIAVDSTTPNSEGGVDAKLAHYSNYHDLISHRRKQLETGMRDTHDSYTWDNGDGTTWEKFNIRADQAFLDAIDDPNHEYYKYQKGLNEVLDGMYAESLPDEYAQKVKRGEILAENLPENGAQPVSADEIEAAVTAATGEKSEFESEAGKEKDPLLAHVAETRKAYALALHNRKKFFRGALAEEQTKDTQESYERAVKELLGKQFENLDVLTPDKQNEIAATLVTEKFKEREELMGALREIESGTFGNRFKQFWKRHAKLRLAVGIGLTVGGVALAPSNLLIGAGLIATRAAMSGIGTTMSVESMWDKLRSNFGKSSNKALNWADAYSEKGDTINDIAKNSETEDLEEMYAAHSLDAAYNNLATGKRRTAIRGKEVSHKSSEAINAELKRRYQEDYINQLKERVSKGEQTDAIIAEQISSSLLDEALVAKKLESRSDKNRRNAIAKWSVAVATGISVGWLVGSKGDYIRDALLGKSAKETGKAALEHPTSAGGSSDANPDVTGATAKQATRSMVDAELAGKAAVKAGKEAAKSATETHHDATVIAKKGDSIWKIIDRELGKRLENYGSMSEAQKTYVIDSLKDKVVASPKTFGLDNPESVTAGQKVDLTALFETKATVAKAAKAAAALTKEQLANIDAGREVAKAAATSVTESVGQHAAEVAQEGKALFKEASLNAADATTTAGRGIATVGSEDLTYNSESALTWPKGMDAFREAATSETAAGHGKSIIIEKAGKVFERIGKLTDTLPESTVQRITDLRVGEFMKRGIVGKLEVMEGVTHNGAEKIAKAVKEIIKQADHARGIKVGRTWTVGILSNIVKVVEKPK